MRETREAWWIVARNNYMTLLTASLLLLGMSAVFALAIASISRHDVVARFASPGSASQMTATFDGVSLSRSHGIRVEYRIVGHDQIKRAQWRLRPFREVVTEK